MKKAAAVIMIIVMMFSLCSPALADTSAMNRYEEAKKLLSEKDYSKAKEMFSSLGAFQDASKYVMYITALEEADSGQYALAVVNLNALGDFLDSGLRVKYYSALSYENDLKYEQAGDVYITIPGFLDSAERYGLLPEKIKARDYAAADRLERAGNLEEALEAFRALGTYSDSPARAKGVEEKILAKRYADADRLEQAGNLEEALKAFKALGNYSDSAQRTEALEEKIRARDYETADKLEKQQQYSAAYHIFIDLNDYLDSTERAALIKNPALYEDAMALADNGEYSRAAKIFTELGEYEDSAEKAYVLGVAEFASTTSQPADGVFVFKHHDLYGIANYHKNIARPALYTEITLFKNGFARYKLKGKWGLVFSDLSTTPAEWDEIGEFKNGTAISRKGQKWTLLFSDGSTDYRRWDSIGDFVTVGDRELAEVTLGGKHGYIDLKGNVVLEAEWDEVSRFNSEGICYIIVKNDLNKPRMTVKDAQGSVYYYGLADAQGNILCEPEYTKLGEADNTGYIPNLYNRQNAMRFTVPQAGNVPMMVRDKENKYGFITLSGRLTDLKYDEAYAFSDGAAAVSEGGLWGFIDTEGNYIIRPQYKKVTSFSEGKADVWVDDSGWHIIDKNNTRIYFVTAGVETADSFMAAGQYEEAAQAYEALLGIDPSLRSTAQDAWYKAAEKKLADQDYDGAIEAFTKAKGYSDADERVRAIHYDLAEAALAAGNWDEASSEFAKAGKYNGADTRIPEPYYMQGEKLLAEQDYDGAIEAFTKTEGYSDADDRILGIHYSLAEAALAAGNWDESSSEFAKAGKYNGADERIPEPYYMQGEKLLAEQDYDGAIEAFTKAEGYSDADDRIMEIHYELAEAALTAGDWDKAAAEFNAAGVEDTQIAINYHKGCSLMAEGKYSDAVDVFLLVPGFRDADDKKTECIYLNAKALLAEGQYEKAYDEFAKIKQYSDTEEILKNEEGLWAIAREKQHTALRTVGASVFYGSYEQDDNTENGPEEIEWIVLDVQKGKSLLISKYGLDVLPYHKDNKDVTWEKCSLRAWLNKEFFETAFTEEEQKAILATNLDNSKSKLLKNWKTKGGNKTKDKVFLLSYDELVRYYGSSYPSKNIDKCRAAATVHAVNNGASVNEEILTSDGETTAWWWLRSVGNTQRFAMLVGYNSISAVLVTRNDVTIRPVIWVDWEKSGF